MVTHNKETARTIVLRLLTYVGTHQKFFHLVGDKDISMVDVEGLIEELLDIADAYGIEVVE